MKTLLIATIVLFCVTGVTSINATELNYTWVKGKTYTFSANSTETFSLSGGMFGVAGSDSYKSTTKFSLKIDKVMADGSAEGLIYLIDYKVTNTNGSVIASLNGVPSNNLTSGFKVDRKGNFEFFSKKKMIVTEKGNFIVNDLSAEGSAGNNSVSASAESGGTKVEAYAEFDPKTGTLKTGYKVTENQPSPPKPKTVEIEIKDDAPNLDIFPYELIELMALPEGELNAGDEVDINMAIFPNKITVTGMDNGIATINYKIETEKSRDMTQTDTKGKTGESGSFGFDMNMGDGMDDMDAEDKAALNMATQAMPDIKGDITSNFDYVNGIFSNIKGHISTSTDVMGMKIEVKSVLEMKLIE